MHVLITLLLGAVTAFALKRHNHADSLGFWRPIAGAAAASFPYVDYIFWVLGPSFYARHHGAETWSVYLLPFFAAALAWGLGRVSRKPWLSFLPVTVVALLVSIIMGSLTGQGLRIYTPFSQNYVAGQVLYTFDLVVFVGLLFTVMLCFALPRWQRDLARLVMVLLVVYGAVLTTFHAKANAFANSYQRAMRLNVIRTEVLPQPLSPLNWRIIIHTTDDRIHDTLVSLTQHSKADDTAPRNRTERVAALYKPMDEAVWRIYRRFGKSAVTPIARAAWVKHVDNRVFRWKMRHAVLKDIYSFDGQDCVRFKDLRAEGAKSQHLGTFLLCPPDNKATAWRFYQARMTGGFSQLKLF